MAVNQTPQNQPVASQEVIGRSFAGLGRVQGKAVFLDRDGTIIVNRHYLSDPAGVELISGARETLHGLLAAGYLLFLFSNQSGVGRGMFPLEAVHRCNARMLELLQLPGAGFTDVCIAPEGPEETVIYRKPSPRFIIEMLSKHSLDPTKSWMVGDSWVDVQAGLNAGVQTALVNAALPAGAPAPIWQCRNLAEFLSKLVRQSL